MHAFDKFLEELLNASIQTDKHLLVNFFLPEKIEFEVQKGLRAILFSSDSKHDTPLMDWSLGMYAVRCCFH